MLSRKQRVLFIINSLFDNVISGNGVIDKRTARCVFIQEATITVAIDNYLCCVRERAGSGRAERSFALP